jgi:hypothetical protein
MIINDPSYLKRFPETKGFFAFVNPIGNADK